MGRSVLQARCPDGPRALARSFDCICERCTALPDRTRAFLCPACRGTVCPRGTGADPGDWACLSCARKLKKEVRAPAPGERHATCPISTEGGTRRVQLVRGEGGGAGERHAHARSGPAHAPDVAPRTRSGQR